MLKEKKRETFSFYLSQIVACIIMIIITVTIIIIIIINGVSQYRRRTLSSIHTRTH